MEKMKLDIWRKVRGYNQAQLAEKAGVSVKSISNYENSGLESATLGSINRILKALDITIEQVDLN